MDHIVVHCRLYLIIWLRPFMRESSGGCLVQLINNIDYIVIDSRLG